MPSLPYLATALAVTALARASDAQPHTTLYGLPAVTAAVHLASGRRTIVSVGIGTVVYVLLVNLA